MNNRNSKRDNFGIHKLLKSDLFLAIFLITFINGLIFVYYKATDNSAISLEDALTELNIMTERLPILNNFINIINMQGKFYSADSQEFINATKELNFESNKIKNINNGVVYYSQNNTPEELNTIKE
jgi:hypothetical protein